MKNVKGIFSRRKEQFKMSFGVARRNVTRSKYRTFLLIFGVLLTVALETGLAISVDTLYDDFILENRNQNLTDITVNPTTWLELSELELLTKDVRQTTGVRRASSVYFFSVSQIINQNLISNVLVYGIDSKNHPDMPNIEILEGSKSVAGNKIVVSETIQRTLNLQIGDIFDLSAATGLNIVNVEIGGVISDRSLIGNKLGFLYIIADINTILSAIPLEYRSSFLSLEIDVSVTDFLRIREIAENIEDKIGLEHYVFVENDVSSLQAAGIRAYQTAMNLVIIASFIVEFLFITNVLAIAIRDRQKEIGILRAVGTKSNQLIEIIGIEILIYAFIGSFIGIFLGIGFSVVLVNTLDQYYTSIEFHAISLYPTSIMAAFLSGIIVALISGLYPIFLAKTMPVVQNIHSRMRSTTSEYSFSRSTWKYTIGAGILLTITAFLLQFFIGPTRFLDFSILSMHFVSIAMIFLGTILMEASILVFLPRIAKKVLFWYSTVTRSISMRNIGREFQKSLFTIMTAAMALTFIIIVGSLSASIIAEVPNYFQDQWGVIDVIAEVPDNNLRPINTTMRLDRWPAINRSAFIQETRTEINTINGYVYGVDAAQYSYFSEPVLRSLLSQPSYQILNSSGGSTPANFINALVTNHLFQRLRVPLGTNISIKVTESRSVNITLAAVIKANVFLGNGEYLYINSSHYQELFNSTSAKWFICKKEWSAFSAKGSMETTFPDAKEITEISSLTELMEQTLIFQSAIFQVLFLESFILAAITQFVCILVTTLHLEREMGVMRSFGLSRGGVFSIYMAESTILGVTALIIGLINGFIGISLLIWYISLSIPINLHIPPANILLWVVASILITFASTIVPAYRSSRKNIVATISGRPMTKNYIEKTPKTVTEGIPVDKPIASSEVIFKEIKPDTTKSASSMNSLRLMWSFFRERKVIIRKIFLGLMVIAVLNYIFDSDMLTSGLVLSDLVYRFLTIIPMFGYYQEEILMNPLLLIVGAAMVTPISYYLSNHKYEGKFIQKAVKSLSIGFISIVILVASWFMLMMIFGIGTEILRTIVMGESEVYGGDNPFLLLSAFFYILFGLLMLVFQRAWVLLVYQGFKPEKSLRNQITWVRTKGSRGQLGFIGLILVHQIIKGFLTFILRAPRVIDYGQYYDVVDYLPPLHPLAFIILMTFEIGFLLLLIIYQLIQFHREESIAN